MAQHHGRFELPHPKYRVVAWQRGRRVNGGGAAVRDRHRSDFLTRYLGGWAEAAPQRIIWAAADDYRLCDPLVGTFRKSSLSDYFECLAARFGASGATTAADLSFVLHPCDPRCQGPGEYRLWREAPRLGLTGESTIVVGAGGVSLERVTYDLNLASHTLRSPPPNSGTHEYLPLRELLHTPGAASLKR